MKMALWQPIETLAGWLAQNALHSALPAVLVAWVCWRRWGSARVRFVLAALLLAKLVLPALPGFSWQIELPVLSEQATLAAPVFEPSAMLVVAASNASATMTVASGIPWWAALWLLGVVVLGSWWFAGHFKVSRWIRRERQSSPVWLLQLLDQESRDMGVDQAPELCVLRRWPQAAVHGWWRPHVLVPEEWLIRLSESEWRVVLRHELAHVRRHDVLWSALGFGVAALHWFHPLGWLALRRLRAEAELLCDEAALTGHGESGRRDYGRLLLRLIESFTSAPPQTVAAFARHRTDIQHRIHMIVQPNPTKTWSRVAAWLILPTLSLALLTAGEKENTKSAARDPQPREQQNERTPTEPPRDEERAHDEEKGHDGKRGKDGERDRDGKREGDGKRGRDGEMRKEGPRDGGTSSIDVDELTGTITIKNGISALSQLNAVGDLVNSEGHVTPYTEFKENIRQIIQDNPGKKILLIVRFEKDTPKDSHTRVSNLLKDFEDVKIIFRPSGESAARNGERSREGVIRDGERPREGARDGDRPKEGPRDGGRPREGDRDGKRGRDGMRETEGTKRGVEGVERGAVNPAVKAPAMVIQLNAAGQVVNGEGRVIPDAEVKQRIEQIARANPGQEIVLRGEMDTHDDSLARVLSLLKDIDVKPIFTILSESFTVTQ